MAVAAVFRIVVVPNGQRNSTIVTGRLAPFRYHVRLHRCGTARAVGDPFYENGLTQRREDAKEGSGLRLGEIFRAILKFYASWIAKGL